MKKNELIGQFKSILKNYNNQINWLRSLITDPQGLRYFRLKTKEERLKEFQETIKTTAAFLEFLGNPQDQYIPVHIAGTSGKGSVTVMIGSILTSLGFKTGVHTSPYLQIPNEKWMINGKIISPSAFSAALEDLRVKYNDFTSNYVGRAPNYGITQVVLTHMIFVQEEVEFGVIETGMGGRYDPTNVLNPVVCVITNVDFDHVEALGPTLSDIAFHKAGIIKPKIPVIIAAKQNEVIRVIEEEAKRNNAPVFLFGRDFFYKITSINQDGMILDIQTPYGEYKNINLSLPGIFQGENAALAVTACCVLAHQRGLLINSEQVNRALMNLRFPGRMERVQTQPTVILDGAHNPKKMAALAESIKKLYPNKKYILVVGMLANKDAEQSLFPVIANAKKVITTTAHVIGKPSIKSEELTAVVKRINPSVGFDAYEDVKTAIKRALDEAKPSDIILITGSLYLLGEARDFWYPKEKLLVEAEMNYGSGS
jgi:dihydrofolate synthase/folylpolyglutamate synthase